MPCHSAAKRTPLTRAMFPRLAFHPAGATSVHQVQDNLGALEILPKLTPEARALRDATRCRERRQRESYLPTVILQRSLGPAPEQRALHSILLVSRASCS